jgi:CRISP-associated protein Cas1
MAVETRGYDSIPDLIPASMLSAFAYCPRLCYIEWVQGENQDSAEIIEGRSLHRWVDSEQDAVPEGFQPIHARSVSLAAPESGVCCRIDLLEGDSNHVTPIEYKRGEAPSIPQGAYESDLVQLCAECLALRENGFQCDNGVVYFIRSKMGVAVNLDDDLVNRTREMIAALQRTAEMGKIPPPLEDSPKCYRCSLAGICLPDEVNHLKEMEAERKPQETVRLLLPGRDDLLPVYIVGQGQTVRKRGDRLEIWSKEGKVSEAKLIDVSQVCLYGGVEITTPAMVELMQRGVPVLHFTHGGWFEGIATGHTHKNVELRLNQFEWARDPGKSLALARSIVAGKIKNCRTMLHRNDPHAPDEMLESLARLYKDAETAESLESLLGIEGAAAGAYFLRFSSMLKPKASEFSF